MTKSWRTVTCMRDAGAFVEMTQPLPDRHAAGSRRGVRRTVTILVVVAIFFYLLAFLQILLMK
jgi:hypothetical protein